MARAIPEINAGSMADIAFLLLIFFLVATTMDVDTGITRILPPPDESTETPPDVRERNVFVVLVNSRDELLVEGEPMSVDDLRDKCKEFYLNPNNDVDLPVKKFIPVEFFGQYETTPNAVVSLQNDRGTSYGTYIKVQNELVAAVRELQDDLAKSKFGMPFDKLSEDKQDAIKLIHPMSISEAEPKNIGGGR